MKTHMTLIAAALTAGGLATAATAQSADNERYSELVAAITNTAGSPETWQSEVVGNQDVAQIEIYKLSEFGEDGTALDAFVETYGGDLAGFQSAIQANGEMNAALSAEGFEASDTVAYRASADDRSVWLIVDDIQ